VRICNNGGKGDDARGGVAHAAGDGLGGGVYVGKDTTVSLSACRVTDNRPGGGTGPTAGRRLVGGMYLAPGGTEFADAATLISGNNASIGGDDVFGNLGTL
jgi:hypothetical protein